MAYIAEICGIDGVGKTSVCRELAKLLPDARLQCFPDYSTAIGQRIRRMLFADQEQVDRVTLQALHACNKIEKLTELQRSGLLICDRYITCATVYGEVDGVDPAMTAALMAALPPAQLHVLLKEDPLVCWERVHSRNEDHYGKRSLARMTHLFLRYMEAAHVCRGATDISQPIMRSFIVPRPGWFVVEMSGKTPTDVAREISGWIEAEIGHSPQERSPNVGGEFPNSKG